MTTCVINSLRKKGKSNKKLDWLIMIKTARTKPAIYIGARALECFLHFREALDSTSKHDFFFFIFEIKGNSKRQSLKLPLKIYRAGPILRLNNIARKRTQFLGFESEKERIALFMLSLD